MSIRQTEKRDLKQYVLGQLARSLAPPGATSERTRFRYAVLGIAVCAEVFRFVHGVGDFVFRSLQKLASDGIVKVPDQSSKTKS